MLHAWYRFVAYRGLDRRGAQIGLGFERLVLPPDVDHRVELIGKGSVLLGGELLEVRGVVM